MKRPPERIYIGKEATKKYSLPIKNMENILRPVLHAPKIPNGIRIEKAEEKITCRKKTAQLIKRVAGRGNRKNSKRQTYKEKRYQRIHEELQLTSTTHKMPSEKKPKFRQRKVEQR